MNLTELNSYCWEEVKKYQNLNIYGSKVNTPYFMNNVEGYFVELMEKVGIKQSKIDSFKTKYRNKEITYGWFRGKGTPEEIEFSTKEISEKVGLSLHNSTQESIWEFMKLYALGVDCSGFVYNVLSYSFRKLKKGDLLNEILDWDSSINKTVSRAGAFAFAGSASFLIKPESLKELDLILIKSPKSNKYIHIALVLKNSIGKFEVVQSTISKFPSGVRSDSLVVDKNKVYFSFKPEIGGAKHSWDNLYYNGYLEFRRLNIFK